MHKGKGFHYKLSKRPGAALLVVVLIGFIVLTILSLVAFNIALSTMRVERWQADHYQEQQLCYLAKSGAIALAEEMKNRYSGSVSDKTKTISKKGTLGVLTADGVTASLDFVVSADSTYDAATANVLIKVTAYNSVFSNDKKIVATGSCTKDSSKIKVWGDGE